MTGKLIIFSAPSGSGKSTIINYLLTQNLNLAFSISATSRPPRGTEQHGVEYFFLTPEEFRCRIENNEFLEYEEVYKDRYYGTLKAQVEKQLEAGQNVVFDVDVVGGCNIKKFYGDRALSVFIQPPSVEELRCRLEGRGTDAPEIIESRIAKAEYELGFAPQFDCVIVNDDLEAAKAEAEKLLNYVRKRYYPAGSSSLYPENGSALTEQELLDEWGREFLGEGLRRQTLCRFGIFNSGTWWDKEPDPDNHTMWIPLSRTTLNTNPNLKQNPGYPSVN